jgi:hypothetical protein
LLGISEPITSTTLYIFFLSSLTELLPPCISVVDRSGHRFDSCLRWVAPTYLRSAPRLIDRTSPASTPAKKAFHRPSSFERRSVPTSIQDRFQD